MYSFSFIVPQNSYIVGIKRSLHRVNLISECLMYLAHRYIPTGSRVDKVSDSKFFPYVSKR